MTNQLFGEDDAHLFPFKFNLFCFVDRFLFINKIREKSKVLPLLQNVLQMCGITLGFLLNLKPFLNPPEKMQKSIYFKKLMLLRFVEFAFYKWLHLKILHFASQYIFLQRQLWTKVKVVPVLILTIVIIKQVVLT